MNRFLPGNRITLLRSGGEYFPSLVQAIDGAEREVWLETYIYADDDVGAIVTAALVRAAQRGMMVRVLVDGWGARHYLTAAIERVLTAGGVRLLKYRPRFLRGRFAGTGFGGCIASCATSTARSLSSAASTSSTT
jgi:cardiolipin synthase